MAEANFSHNMLKLVNVGSEDFKGRYQQNTLTVRSGSEMYVPFAAAVAWFGDPTAINEGRHKDRDDEWHRLRVMWAGEKANDEVHWDYYAPKIEVYDLNGERMWMIHDDPLGENLNFNTGIGQTTDSQLELLKAQVAALTAALNNLTTAPAPTIPPDSDVDDDVDIDEEEEDDEEEDDSVTHGHSPLPASPPSQTGNSTTAKKATPPQKATLDSPKRPPVNQ